MDTALFEESLRGLALYLKGKAILSLAHPDSGRGNILFPDGVQIEVRSGDRFHFHGCFPESDGTNWGQHAAGHGVSLPSIACAKDKSFAVIARDVERRLLPAVRALYPKALELQADHNAYNAKVERNIQSFLKLGGELRRDGMVHFSRLGYNGYGSAQVSSDSATFEIRSLPLDRAIRIWKILNEPDKESVPLG